MRPVEDWADRKYVDGSAYHHVVPFGEGRAICGADVTSEWLGTGTFDEFEAAMALATCPICARHLPPRPALNEFTAPSPLYTHQEIA